MSISGDSWYVKLSDGDVHRVTLDQLDEAFQAGHIDGNTMVLASGATQWTKLGALAGIDDDGEEVDADEGSSPAIAAAPHGPTAQAMSTAAGGFSARPASGGPQGSTTRPAAALPQGYAAPATMIGPSAPVPLAQPMSGMPSTYGTLQPQIRPIGVPPQGGLTAAPSHLGAPAYMPRTPLPNSLRPMSLDFEDLGSDGLKLRRGRGKRWVFALLTISILGAVGAISVQRPYWARPLLNRIGLRGAAEPAVATAPPAFPAAQPTPPAPPAPVVAAPEPVPPAPAATAGADSPLSPHFTDRNDRLTDDQKERLAETGKQKAKAHKARAAAGASHHATGKTKSTTFTTGGSKYDPLNSSI